MAIPRPRSIRDWSWSGEAAYIFFSTRGVFNGPSSTDADAIAACRRFPVVIVLNKPIACQGEKPTWWLAPAKMYRKQKEMCCSSPNPSAGRIQRRAGWGYPFQQPPPLTPPLSLSTPGRYDGTQPSGGCGWVQTTAVSAGNQQSECELAF